MRMASPPIRYSNFRLTRIAMRARRSAALAAVGVWLAGVPAEAECAQFGSRPAVRIVATGGTIANHPDGRLTAAELAALIPGARRHAEIETEQFANVPSSALTVAHWLRLAQRLNRLFATRGDLAGVVVTSGTDTLEETAYFLHLTVRTSRPLVVVGAMRRPDAPGYDGAANLLQAVRVAAAPASRGRGAVVVINGEIHGARAVRKAHAQRLDSFDSGRRGLLGVVDADRVEYFRRPGRRHTQGTEFDVSGLDRLPRVVMLTSYVGAGGDLVRAARDLGAAGIVMAGAGAGATTPAQADAVDEVIADGVVVVTATRTGGGRVPARMRRIRGRAGTNLGPQRVSGEDLSPVKARVLLMLALTKTRNPAEIQRLFTAY
jgi:L-asparaginase